MKNALLILTAGIVSATVGFAAAGPEAVAPAASPVAGTPPGPAAICVAVCGDSTVATYPEGDANKSVRGWGQMLGSHFLDNVKVVNLASGGQSTKSFLDKGRFGKALDLKPQFVFIQFGHNDCPGKGPDRQTDPNTTYSDNLRSMIDKARSVGAECILVTPMERRYFDKDGKVRTDLLGPYSAAMKRVGKEKDVLVIDLHDKSVEIYERLGPKAAQEQLGPSTADGTHFGERGARLWADIICQELANAPTKYDALKNAIRKPVAATSSPADGKK